MSESIILCEGFHDRAFWDGWLSLLGCKSDGFRPGTAGFPALDPWNAKVGAGQLAFRSKSGNFIRVSPCKGRSNILREARIRLSQRFTKSLVRLVVNIDADTDFSGMPSAITGLRRQDVFHQVQQIDPQSTPNA